MNTPTPFQNYLLRWYSLYGRHELPWRKTDDPYKILVSEMMLQQTQVERVIPKYLAFIEAFPNAAVLAAAPLSDVLTLWQGLGYNRRAQFLQKTAHAVAATKAGAFPTSQDSLQELPGIGPYTSAAICAFAYNQPILMIETNIRAVFIYHFFPGKSAVTDAELLPLITTELWHANPREWYAALMDYGSVLKKLLPNPSRRSKHHVTQSSFKGSARQVRGEIIRLLTKHKILSLTQLETQITGNKQHFAQALRQLQSEGLVHELNKSFSINDAKA